MISVIIPTYNRASTIFDAVQSVLNQTYREIELIIIDDGSTDNTKDIIENISDERLRYIKLKDNSGACKARNVGIDVARGEYIAFQDSDDIWRISKLESQLAFLDANSADMVFCAIDRYEFGSALPIRKPYNGPSILNSRNEVFFDLLYGNTISMVTVICRSECAKLIRFDESLPRGQDWDWALRVAQKYQIKYQNEVMVDSYAQEDSISYSPQKLVTALQIIYGKNRTIIEKDKRLFRHWITQIANASFNAGFGGKKEYIRAFLFSGQIKFLIKYLICIWGLQKIYLTRKEKINTQ